MLLPDERARQLALVRSEAVAAGRDPDAVEYTRWSSVELTVEAVEGYAAQGVTRLVLGATAIDRAQQFDEMSAFAERFGLSATVR
ncbi:hypothetical protein [Nocardia sp. NPDC050710]|uniref:hypothetical protein n=1 Tax=Nocardia sp. NPDC050710 TaxID=3157220 RepID=UPI0033FBCA23